MPLNASNGIGTNTTRAIKNHSRLPRRFPPDASLLPLLQSSPDIAKPSYVGNVTYKRQ
jgi:hypothetical protein